MFDIAWSELLIIGVVALVVIGPKDLPKAMRVAGQWLARARETARQFQSAFDDMAKAEEVAELRREVENLRRLKTAPLSYDPLPARPAPGAEAPASVASTPAADAATPLAGAALPIAEEGRADDGAAPPPVLPPKGPDRPPAP